MFTWLSNLFCSVTKGPEIGEIWVMYPAGPWRKNLYVKILDIKEGWVKYEYCNVDGEPNGDLEWDDRIKYFVDLFQKLQ